MDEPRDYHTKQSKSSQERKMSYDTTYMWKQKICKWTYLHNRKKFTDVENKLFLTKWEKEKGRIN